MSVISPSQELSAFTHTGQNPNQYEGNENFSAVEDRKMSGVQKQVKKKIGKSWYMYKEMCK